MAGRTPLTVTAISRFATVSFTLAVFADAANGNVCPNDGATFLSVFNNDSSIHNLTVQVVSGVDGLTAGPRSYAIPVTPGPTQLVGPYPLQWYGAQLLLNADSALIKIQPYSLLSS
jgi:hypothetical protein